MLICANGRYMHGLTEISMVPGLSAIFTIRENFLLILNFRKIYNPGGGWLRVVRMEMMRCVQGGRG